MGPRVLCTADVIFDENRKSPISHAWAIGFSSFLYLIARHEDPIQPAVREPPPHLFLLLLSPPSMAALETVALSQQAAQVALLAGHLELLLQGTPDGSAREASMQRYMQRVEQQRRLICDMRADLQASQYEQSERLSEARGSQGHTCMHLPLGHGHSQLAWAIRRLQCDAVGPLQCNIHHRF